MAGNQRQSATEWIRSLKKGRQNNPDTLFPKHRVERTYNGGAKIDVVDSSGNRMKGILVEGGALAAGDAPILCADKGDKGRLFAFGRAGFIAPPVPLVPPIGFLLAPGWQHWGGSLSHMRINGEVTETSETRFLEDRQPSVKLANHFGSATRILGTAAIWLSQDFDGGFAFGPWAIDMWFPELSQQRLSAFEDAFVDQFPFHFDIGAELFDPENPDATPFWAYSDWAFRDTSTPWRSTAPPPTAGGPPGSTAEDP